MMLAQVRAKMMEQGHCRKTINRNIGRIIRAWKWGVSQGLVKVATWQALTTLQGLQAGRCDVPESEAVQPVALADVEAVKPFLPIKLQGAVDFQLATAARPGVALTLRLCDIDRSGDASISPVRTRPKNAPEELKQEAALWRAKHCWAPKQLRHTAATEIRKAAGRTENDRTLCRAGSGRGGGNYQKSRLTHVNAT